MRFIVCAQHSVTYDLLRYINILTYLPTYQMALFIITLSDLLNIPNHPIFHVLYRLSYLRSHWI